MKVYHGNVRFKGRVAKAAVFEWVYDSPKDRPERIEKDKNEDVYRGFVHADSPNAAKKRILMLAMKSVKAKAKK